MNRPNILGLVAAVVAFVILGAACSSAEVSSPTTTLDDTPTSVAQVSIEEAPLVSSVALPEDKNRDRDAELRLIAGLGLGSVRSDEESQARLQEEQALLGRQEEFIQACMAREGFDYFYDPPEQRIQRSVGFEYPYGSAEWADRYGLGASTLLFTQDELGPDLVGSPEPMVWPSVDEANDPTSLQLEALGEAGQAAYWKALFGLTPGTFEVSEADRDKSCSGQASVAHPDQFLLLELEWGETEIRELRERIDTEDEVRDMLRLGELCVQAEGFSATSRFAATLEMEEQIQVLFEIDPGGMGDPEFIEMLGSIQDYEIELATALTKCGVGAQLEAPVRERVAIRLGYEMGVLVLKDEADD